MGAAIANMEHPPHARSLKLKLNTAPRRIALTIRPPKSRPPPQPQTTNWKACVDPYKQRLFRERIPLDEEGKVADLKNKPVRDIRRSSRWQDKHTHKLHPFYHQPRPSLQQLHHRRWRGTPCSQKLAPQQFRRQRRLAELYDNDKKRRAAEERATVIFKPMPEVLDLFIKTRKNRHRSHVKQVIDLARALAKETEHQRLMAGYSSVVRAYACLIFAHGVFNAPIKLDTKKLYDLFGSLPERPALVSALTVLYNTQYTLEDCVLQSGGSVSKLWNNDGKIWEDVRKNVERMAGKLAHDRVRDEMKRLVAERWEGRTVGNRERLDEMKRGQYLQVVEGVMGSENLEGMERMRWC